MILNLKEALQCLQRFLKLLKKKVMGLLTMLIIMVAGFIWHVGKSFHQENVRVSGMIFLFVLVLLCQLWSMISLLLILTLH